MKFEIQKSNRLSPAKFTQTVLILKSEVKKTNLISDTQNQNQNTHMTYHTIATNAALWAEHTDDEPFAGTLAERIAYLEVLFHYEAQDNA